MTTITNEITEKVFAQHYGQKCIIQANKGTIPSHLLNGKTLRDCGLAVYPSDLRKEERDE